MSLASRTDISHKIGSDGFKEIVVQGWDLQCYFQGYFQGCVLFIFKPLLDLQQAGPRGEVKNTFPEHTAPNRGD